MIYLLIAVAALAVWLRYQVWRMETTPWDPNTARPGSPLWFEILAPFMQTWCVLRGGHVHDVPHANMACSRCGWWYGDGYKPTVRSIWEHWRVVSLYWCQINRYRDDIRPWAGRHPRLAAVLLGLYACRKCGDLQPMRYLHDGCETCHITYFLSGDWAEPRRVRPRRKRRPKPEDIAAHLKTSQP